MNMLKSVLFILLVATTGWAGSLKLPPVFADQMILQRGQSVPVWGWAEPKTEVTVRFSGQEKKAVADADGKWRIDFQPLEASANPQVLSIASGNESLQISDVLVGEVWLCGGQSNMEWTLNQLKGDARDPQYQPISDYLRNEIATANDPLLRYFKVERIVSAREEQDDSPGQWYLAVNGQVENISGTGYFFGRELRKELGVPVALLGCNWGGTLVEPWIPASAFQKDAAMKTYFEEQHKTLAQNEAKWDETAAKAKFEKQMDEWKVKAAEAKAAGKGAPRKPRMQQEPNLSNRVPSTLYNGMMHSLVPYGMKGAIWYQGESNRNHYPEAYAKRFSTLIDSWREAWGQDKLFFYWCQLAKYTNPPEKPVDNDGWVTVCDAQCLTMAKPDTGMAVLNDIGEAKDIHPKNKVDAGKRLSLWALNQAYGQDLVPSGPIYKDFTIKKNKIIVRFSHVGSGLMVGNKHLMDPVVEVKDPLNRFQICGDDGTWKWAEAEITGKGEVTVWHEDVVQPVEVRYAWAANAEGANLYNKEGLPASLFKTHE